MKFIILKLKFPNHQWKNITSSESKIIQLMINENESSNIIFCLDISSSMYKKHKRETSRFYFMESFINNYLAQINKKIKL